ncbi:MAG TPA: CopG family transcriptional regulator [Polyangiaceae bacterium]
MSTVRKTTVYLDEADYRALKGLARAQGRKPAVLLREAVASYTKAHAKPRRRPRSIGSGHSGRGNVAEHGERLLNRFGRS